MRVVLELRHPAYVHNFLPFIGEMTARGHALHVLAVRKDVCTELLDGFGVPYTLIGEKRPGLARTAAEMVRQAMRVARVCRAFRPDVLVGHPSPPLLLAGRALGLPSIVFAEDDVAAAPLVGVTAHPLATVIVAPEETRLGRWERKKVGFPGYLKLARLHPARFVPDVRVADEARGSHARLFVVRATSLRAHHDRGVRGLDDALLRRVVARLAPEGRVFLSAERRLPPDLELLRPPLDPVRLHDLLHSADLLVSDSQSMSVEAAVLGTPSIRFSGFAGRISVLETLEHRYGLTFGVPTEHPERLVATIDRVLAVPRQTWRDRRDRMVEEKIDVAPFMVWFVEAWPHSLQAFRTGADVFAPFRCPPLETTEPVR